jgi:hypothetical protein
MKIAVVTPYCQESPDILRRCIDSVKAQTESCIHYLVADGHPDYAVVTPDPARRHIVLPVAHRDYGGVARATGALAAAAEGCDAVAWLDADNWYRPFHLKTLRRCHEKTGAVLCASWRSFHRPDGSLMPVNSLDEQKGEIVDTNCWLVLRTAFELLPVWLMPAGLSPIGDRIFFEAAKHRRFNGAMTRRRSVCYTSLYRNQYERLGETPPPGAKSGVLQAGRTYLDDPANHAGIVAALGFLPKG